MQLVPYLAFNGDCEKAINFYKDCLNGNIENISYFGDSPMEVAESDKKRVMHSTFRFGNNVMMASDSMPSQPVAFGSNISMSVNVEDEKSMEQIFNKLADQGRITMPLEDTFWGARFGMLIDKFGIHWMFNCEKKK
jgi:PhnB protein